MVSYLSSLIINATELDHYPQLQNIQIEMNVGFQ